MANEPEVITQEPEVKPDPEPEIKPESKPELEPKPEPEVEVEPEVKPGPEVKKEGEEAEGEKQPKVDTQARIDRMYARLQQEREKRVTAEVERDIVKKHDEDTVKDTTSSDKMLTRDDVEAIWNRQEKEKRFKESETRVILRHSDALNADGTFNMNSEFTRRYIELGRKNPMLAMMENGPELAEAQVEKEMGILYKKGRTDEAQRIVRSTNAHTASSTTAVGANKVVKLTDVQAKIAARMRMTHQQYATYQDKINKGDKRVGV